MKNLCILMFGKKGNDFVFKIGSKCCAEMISAEEALLLFSAELKEVPVELSKDFDSTYQEVKRRCSAVM